MDDNHIQILDRGLIYRNPKPHLRSVQALHPSLALGSDGTLLACFDLGQAPESLDYGTYITGSADLGKTWSPPRPLFDDLHNGHCNLLARIRTMNNGEIVGLGVKIFRDNPEEGFFNRSPFGYARTQLFLTRSCDQGRHWTSPALIEPPLEGPFELCHPIVELRDGRWLAPMSTLPNWEGHAPNGTKAIALVSDDRGRSWPNYTVVMPHCSDDAIYLEQGLVQLLDDRLLAVTWAFHPESGLTEPTPYALSDNGRTFNPLKRTGFHGQTTKIICLKRGAVLAVYRRHDKKGLWANLATIDGEQWKNLTEVLLWQGAPSGMVGRASAADELAELKFGSPNLLELPDGTVMCAFWCHEDQISVIRWIRLRIS